MGSDSVDERFHSQRMKKEHEEVFRSKTLPPLLGTAMAYLNKIHGYWDYCCQTRNTAVMIRASSG